MKIIILVLCLSGFSAAQDSAIVYFDILNEKLDMALKGLKMVPSDLSLRDDYLEKDRYRISLIDSFMQTPRQTVSQAENLLNSTIPLFSEYFPVNTSSAILEPDPFAPHYLAPETYVSEYFKPGKVDKVTLYRIAYFLAGIEKIKSLELFDIRKESLLDSLVYGFTILLEEDVEDEFRTIDELEEIRKYEEEWTEILTDITGGIDLYSISHKGQEFLNIFDDYIINDEFDIITKSKYIEIKTPLGLICVGDSSSQHYTGDIFIVIDYGGNDVYQIDKQGTRNFLYILDYGGNDTYYFPKNRISPYALGVNLVVDFNGDDIYHAGSWGLGSGFLGTGILWDKKGNDRYYGDTFTMGAGCFGYGLLRDDEGDDYYSAALYSQGFGFVGGIGILFDSSGHDHYFAGGKYRDIFHYKDHYMSLSQGFATGLRPYMSGGIGYLIDRSGNDTYESDVFGQGCSYWWSLGILADGSGNDKYLSYLYAQGSATHMSVGCLYDDRGDDLYLASGVSQGCGHDRAFGVLIDLTGDDNYIGFDLVQGAGSANGIGVLFDLEGIDSYLVKKAHNTQGYGNPRRDYGSIGIFIDLGAEKDTYAGGPGKDSSWWSGSKWGIGIDE